MTAHRLPHRSFASAMIAVIAIIALAPLLAGCGGLLSSAPERPLYRVSPKFTFRAGLPHVAAQLLIATPLAPAGLDTERIALSKSPVSLNYFADAQWADRTPFLVQTALVNGFEKSGALPAVGPDSGGLSADFVMETAIDHFEAIYDSPKGAPLIRVALEVKLVRMPGRRIVAHTSVSREQRAAANAVPDIVRAFEGALGGAVEDVVSWTVSIPTLSEKHR